jgi:thioredoxin reductase (NADPH)
LRHVSYYAKCDYERFTGKRVLVVGGGNTTAKNAILAKTKAKDVTLIHRRDSMRAYRLMVKRLQKEGVDIMYNTELKEIIGDDVVKGAIVVNNKTNEEEYLPLDWIVICVGTEPNVKLAKESGVAFNNSYVKVDESMMTNRRGIFACGEIVGCDAHIITCASSGATTGMRASEYLAMERIRRGEEFEGAISGKYADEYVKTISEREP